MPEQKQKSPQALQSQTDHEKITLIESIPQDSKNIPIIDFFVGSVRDFRSYIKAKCILLEAGVIAP